MKGIWRTNPAGDAFWPDWVKLHAAGVTQIYIPLYKYDRPNSRFIVNDTELTEDYKRGVESKGFEYRTYNCWNWIPEYLHPEAMVWSVKTFWHSFGVVPKHMYNIEIHDSDFVETALRYHRQLFPTGPISWAMEGMQGGWFKPSLIRRINGDINCVAVPENFDGAMNPIGVSKVRGNLITAGITAPRVKVFLAPPDLVNHPTWDGCILSEETL